MKSTGEDFKITGGVGCGKVCVQKGFVGVH